MKRGSKIDMFGPVVATIDIHAGGAAFLKVKLPLPKMDLQKLLEDGRTELMKTSKLVTAADHKSAHVHV